MRITISLTVLLLVFSCLTDAIAEDLIRVRATVYELTDPVSNEVTQTELSALAEKMAGKADWLKIDLSGLTRSGKEVVTRNQKQILFPEGYTEPQLLRSSGDTETYSLADSGTTKHSSTVIIPTHPTVLNETALGTTLKLRPNRRADGSIQVEGSFQEVTLVDLKEENKPSMIHAARGVGGTRKVELTSNFRKTPILSTVEEKFSANLHDAESVHYFIVKTKRSCLVEPLEGSNEQNAASGVRVITSPVSGESTLLPVYPARYDEEVTLLVALQAEAIALPESIPQEKGDHVYLMVRLVESDFTESWAKPILSDPEFQLMIRALNQRKGVDLLSAPSIMAVSGESAKIEVGRELVYPIAFDPVAFDPDFDAGGNGFPVSPAKPTKFENRKLGVEIELTGRIRSDGMIEVEANSRISESVGMLNFGNPVVQMDSKLLGNPVAVVLTENQIQAPVVSVREQNTLLVISSGSTGVAMDLTDTQAIKIEDKGPLGLNSRKFTEKVPRQLTAFIKVQRVEK